MANVAVSVCAWTDTERPCSCFTCTRYEYVTNEPPIPAVTTLVARYIFRCFHQPQKCPTDNKSILELSCLTRFQPRLSCLFIVIGLTMSLRCGFVWSLSTRSPVIVLGYSFGERLCLCLYDDTSSIPAYCSVNSPLSIHNWNPPAFKVRVAKIGFLSVI